MHYISCYVHFQFVSRLFLKAYLRFFTQLETISVDPHGVHFIREEPKREFIAPKGVLNLLAANGQMAQIRRIIIDDISPEQCNGCAVNASPYQCLAHLTRIGDGGNGPNALMEPDEVYVSMISYNIEGGGKKNFWPFLSNLENL